MQNTIKINPVLNPNRTYSVPSFITRYLAYTKKQEEHQMLWYILGLVLIPCVAIILSVFAMHFLAFGHMAFYMASTFLMYYAIVVAHLSGAKASVYISLFFLNIVYLIGAPLLVLLLS